uniref:Uncharacterized protein n=1 Tax=Neogobius melanostomus TaxID=47308 RepID=A0A8C6TYF6_9GOBI
LKASRLRFTACRREDQQRDKSRVTLHKLYPRWRDLRDRLGFTMDTELAEMLMDR